MQEKNLKRCVRFRFILSTGVAVLHAPFVLTHSERFLLFAKYRSNSREDNKKRNSITRILFYYGLVFLSCQRDSGGYAPFVLRTATKITP